MLPLAVRPDLVHRLTRLKLVHAQDLRNGRGFTTLPHALSRRYPNLSKSWLWQYVFSASKHVWHEDTLTGRRHHAFDDTLQRAVSAAGRVAQIEKPVSVLARIANRADGLHHRTAGAMGGRVQAGRIDGTDPAARARRNNVSINSMRRDSVSQGRVLCTRMTRFLLLVGVFLEATGKQLFPLVKGSRIERLRDAVKAMISQS